MSEGNNDPERPFEREESLDEKGIVGARWWNRSLQDKEKQLSRRGALQGLVFAGATVAVIGGLGVTISKCSDDDEVDFQPMSSVELQQRYGWDVGAAGMGVVYDGREVTTFDQTQIAHMMRDIVDNAGYPAMQVRTLFMAPGATATQRPGEETTPSRPFGTWLRPALTASMSVAYRVGQAVARILRGSTKRTALVVDLRGHDSVAFAAGAAEVFAPVWNIDDWPHPRGVVDAHTTLSSALFFQPRFRAAAAVRPADAPPMFVLDRRRLAPYVDASDRFDNRYAARLPAMHPSSPLAAVERVLYVVPNSTSLPELDDVNDVLVSSVVSGALVRAIDCEMFFTTEPLSDMNVGDEVEALIHHSPVYYGGTVATEQSFFADYGWGPLPAEAVQPMVDARSRNWTPSQRVTAFTRGARPLNFGLTAVALAVATRAVLGLRSDRRGSWNRVSGGWGG